MNGKFFLLVVTAGVLFAISCSGGGSSTPILPGNNNLTNHATESSGPTTSKASWGVWGVSIDPQTWVVSIVPLRGTEYTVDVVTFLQKPAGNPANLSIKVTDTSKWMSDGLITVDVGLRHPFPGLDEYTGFDVLGVFVTPGTMAGKYDGDVTFTNGDSEPILLNADGYTRWMNPVEFPQNGTIFRFTPGKLGSPDITKFTSTINGYKYFADGLDKSQDLGGFFTPQSNVNNRGMFQPGSTNLREYKLKFAKVSGSPTIVFQYAVVASWIVPDKTLSGDPDKLDVPGDFPWSANANEAVNLSVTDNSTLWYKDGSGGGEVDLKLEVYDWGALRPMGNVPDEIYGIAVDAVSPAGFTDVAWFAQSQLAALVLPGSSSISSVFEVEINKWTPASTQDMRLLITVESESPSTFDPGNGTQANSDRLAAYFLHDVHVSGTPQSPIQVISPNGGETLWMTLNHNITWDPGPGGIANVKIEWSTDNFASDIRTIVASTPNDGSFTWQPIPNVATTTAKVRVSDVLGTASDNSDNNFTIAVPVWLDFQDEVGVGDSTVTWNYCWLPYVQSFDEISPALSQDLDGTVHMCWPGQTAFNPLPSGPWMAHDVTIRSTNGTAWNGEADCLHTEGGAYPGTPMRTDNLKLASASNNETFAAVKLFMLFFCPDVDAWKDYNFEYNYNNLGPFIDKNDELMADDTYLYLIGDYDGPGIYCQRVLTPDPIWQNTGIVTYSNNGEVSHVRSWAIQSDQLVLGFYTTSGQIKLLRQTDKPLDTWDDTQVIFNGSGYNGCKDPALAVDGDGRLFAVWTGQNSSTNKFEILASMKSTQTGTWTTPIVAASSDIAFNDCSVTTSADKVLLPTGDSEYMVLIGYENNGVIQSQISPKDLWAFLPEHQVSTETVPTQEPDVLCPKSPYTFDALFTWSFEVTPGDLGVGDHDIKFRNADFKTP